MIQATFKLQMNELNNDIYFIHEATNFDGAFSKAKKILENHNKLYNKNLSIEGICLLHVITELEN